jgi:hypothetical protein
MNWLLFVMLAGQLWIKELEKLHKKIYYIRELS